MKHYKKNKLRVWKNIKVNMYNLNLHVILFEDTQLLQEWLNGKHGYKNGLPLDEDYVSGMCVPMNNGYLVLINNTSVDLEVVVHELIHVRQLHFTEIGMYSDGNYHVSNTLMEAEAYFTTHLLNKVLKKIKKHTNGRL